MDSCSLKRAVGVLLFTTMICSAQHYHEAMMTTGGKQALKGAIDGSVTPQLIPDSTAYRVFFRAFTADSDLDRKLAMLNRAQLSSRDFGATLQIGAKFEALRSAYKLSESQAITDAQTAGAQIDQNALTAQRESIGTNVKSMLAASLTPQGMKTLDGLIQSEKRNMTVFPMPDMSGAK